MDKLILAFSSLPGLLSRGLPERNALIGQLCRQLPVGLEECSFNLALEDPAYPGGAAPIFKVIITLRWLQALDDPSIPLRAALDWSAPLVDDQTKLQVWAVKSFVPWCGERPPLPGEQVPGFKLIVFSYRLAHIDRKTFEDKYRNEHTPKVAVHCPGIGTYQQNFVQRQLHGDILEVDGVAEMNFRTAEDFTERFHANAESGAFIRAGAATFMDNSRAQYFSCTETLWCFP